MCQSTAAIERKDRKQFESIWPSFSSEMDKGIRINYSHLKLTSYFTVIVCPATDLSCLQFISDSLPLSWLLTFLKAKPDVSVMKGDAMPNETNGS